MDTDISPDTHEAEDADFELIDPDSTIPTDPNTNADPNGDIDADINAAGSRTSSDSDFIPDIEELRGDMDNVRESQKLLQSFLPVDASEPTFSDRANEVTQPTDLTEHTKTKSDVPLDMFTFFQSPADLVSSDDESDPKAKRPQSMAAINDLEFDPLSFENLRAHTEREDNLDEEKNAQPLDDLSQHSNPGSEHLELNEHLDPTFTVEERIEPFANGDPHGDAEYDRSASAAVTPGILDKEENPPDVKHLKKPSIQEMVAQAMEDEIHEDPELSAALDMEMRSGGDPMMMNMNGNSMNMGLALNGNGMSNEMPVMANFVDDGHSHGADAMYMDMMKKFVAKEQQFKQDIELLEQQLDEAEQELDQSEKEKNNMRINYETQISQIETREQEQKEAYEKERDDLTEDFNTDLERLRSDNQTKDSDLKLLRQEIQGDKQQMDDLRSQLNDALTSLDEKKIEWELHREQCPLLNAEVAQQLAEQRQKEIQRYKMGSQQLDDQVTQLLSTEKDLEDERDRLKDENKSKQEMLDTKDLEIKTLREALDQIKAENNQNSGALRELRIREQEERRGRMELEQNYEKLTNEYDMLLSYANEQAQVLEQAQMVPSGVDPQLFEAVRTKQKLFRPSVTPTGKRSIVRSLGGLSDFADHMRQLSNISENLRSGKLGFQYDEKDDLSETASHSSYQSTDFGSIASHFTRYSFRPYHVHDATREFFFLLALCVKLSLAHKYGISPDMAPKNDSLWSQALKQNIKFHEYPEFLHNELTNLYEYNFKAQQGTIRNVVITDRHKIREREEANQQAKRLERKMQQQSYLYSQFENYTKGHNSVENRMRAVRDRTYFSPNDDLFGGHTKVTTRIERQLRMEKSARSRSDAASSHRSPRAKGRSKRKSRKSGSSREPGNRKDAQNHPLNANPHSNHSNADKGGRRRETGKLSEKPTTPSGGPTGSSGKKRGRHLTQESLDMLDPDKNLNMDR